MDGVKHDQTKRRWTLIPWGPLGEVVDVLEFGAAKYAVDNWQKVGRDRYVDAMIRHVAAYVAGERNDPESGLHHLAHAVCCGLFVVWFDGRQAEPHPHIERARRLLIGRGWRNDGEGWMRSRDRSLRMTQSGDVFRVEFLHDSGPLRVYEGRCAVRALYQCAGDLLGGFEEVEW
jgi:hypothetical protein